MFCIWENPNVWANTGEAPTDKNSLCLGASLLCYGLLILKLIFEQVDIWATVCHWRGCQTSFLVTVLPVDSVHPALCYIHQVSEEGVNQVPWPWVSYCQPCIVSSNTKWWLGCIYGGVVQMMCWLQQFIMSITIKQWIWKHSVLILSQAVVTFTGCSHFHRL